MKIGENLSKTQIGNKNDKNVENGAAGCKFKCPTICTRSHRAELLGSDGINYSLAGQQVLADIVVTALFPPEP